MIGSGTFLRWALRIAAGLLGVIVVVLAVAWWKYAPVRPDAFYAQPSSVPSKPGQLLRAEPFKRDVPHDARGWRILYTTTRDDGSAAIASAIVLAPTAVADGAHPIMAWMHGTTGIAQGCAPSLMEHPFDGVPALDAALKQGWVIVATDYAGMGTAGLHHYLVGADEAHSGLDAIRAVRELRDVSTANNVIVWGHSQGGHAALWTGLLSASYAPDVHIAGVAALAPGTNLPVLVDRSKETVIGKILSAYVVTGYSGAYDDVSPFKTLRLGAWLVAKDMAGRCLDGPSVTPLFAEATWLQGSIFANSPMSGTFGKRLAENSPDGRNTVPVLIAQGLDDNLVLPSVQQAYIQRMCAKGASIDYHTYTGRDHISLIADDSPLNADLIRWSQDALQGIASSKGCVATLH